MTADEIAAIKVPGKTAIPEGTYNVDITFSERFQRNMPLVENVPGYAGIRIHPGNYPVDTEGCLLPGTTHDSADFVGNSRIAFEALYPKLQAALKVGAITLTIDRTIISG